MARQLSLLSDGKIFFIAAVMSFCGGANESRSVPAGITTSSRLTDRRSVYLFDLSPPPPPPAAAPDTSAEEACAEDAARCCTTPEYLRAGSQTAQAASRQAL